MTQPITIADRVDLLTPDWLSTALRSQGHEITVESLDVEPVGTGQMGESYRLRFTLDGESDLPATMIAKIPTPNEDMRTMVAGAYRGELSFYRAFAPTLAVRSPDVHYTAATGDCASFVLLMEDLAPRRQGDQIAGCTARQAEHAVVNLAGLHAGTWCDEALLTTGWLAVETAESAAMTGEFFDGALTTFLERFGHTFNDADTELLRAVGAELPAWLSRDGEPFALVHGDYRLDNLMFPLDPADPDVVALDWQTLAIGLPARDLAYFLSTGLDPAIRRTSERALVAAYHGALVDQGVVDYPFDRCFDDYRIGMMHGPLIIVFGAAYSTPTERGDAMFITMLKRSLTAIRDHGVVRG